MKRSTLFLLSYSIIIPLVTSSPKPLPAVKVDINSLSVDKFGEKCKKYSTENYVNVRNYVEQCKVLNQTVVRPFDLFRYSCFGVVNNILVACDMNAVNVLDYLNDSINKTVTTNESTCPLETSNVEEYLSTDKNFEVLITKYLNNKARCETFCIDINQAPDVTCFLWHKTNEMLKNFTSQPNADTKPNQQTIIVSSQGVEKATGEEKATIVGTDGEKPAPQPPIPPEPEPLKPEAPKPAPLKPDMTKPAPVQTPVVKKEPPAAAKPVTTVNINLAPKPITNSMETVVNKKPDKTEINEETPKQTIVTSDTGNKNTEPEKTVQGGEAPNIENNQSPVSQDQGVPNLEDDQGNFQGDADKADQSGIPNGSNNVGNEEYQDGEFNNNDETLLVQGESPKQEKSMFEDENLESNKNPQPAGVSSQSVSSNVPSETIAEEESNFYVYFFTSASIVILGYVAFHNKNKILAYALEGRRSRNGRRRPNSASYRKLECSLEEAITSNSSHASVTNVVY